MKVAVIPAEELTAVLPVALQDLKAPAEPAAVLTATSIVRHVAAVAHTAAVAVEITAMAPVNAAQTCDTCVFPNGQSAPVHAIFHSRSVMRQIHHFRSTHHSMGITTAPFRTAHPDQYRPFHTMDQPRPTTRSQACLHTLIMQCPPFRELLGNFAALPTMATC